MHYLYFIFRDALLRDFLRKCFTNVSVVKQMGTRIKYRPTLDNGAPSCSECVICQDMPSRCPAGQYQLSRKDDTSWRSQPSIVSSSQHFGHSAFVGNFAAISSAPDVTLLSRSALSFINLSLTTQWNKISQLVSNCVHKICLYQ